MPYSQLQGKKGAKKTTFQRTKPKPVEFQGLYLGDNNFDRIVFELEDEEYSRLVKAFTRPGDTSSCFKHDSFYDCNVAVGKMSKSLDLEKIDEKCEHRVCTVKGEINRYAMDVTAVVAKDELDVDRQNDGEIGEDDEPSPKEEPQVEQRIGASLTILSIEPLPMKKQPIEIQEMVKKARKAAHSSTVTKRKKASVDKKTTGITTAPPPAAKKQRSNASAPASSSTGTAAAIAANAAPATTATGPATTHAAPSTPESKSNRSSLSTSASSSDKKAKHVTLPTVTKGKRAASPTVDLSQEDEEEEEEQDEEEDDDAESKYDDE